MNEVQNVDDHNSQLKQKVEELREIKNELFKKYKTASDAYQEAKKQLDAAEASVEEAKREQKIARAHMKAAEWEKPDFPWTKKLYNVLKEKFNFNEFRPNQLAALNLTLSRRDALVVMPTGSGKSLVYQLASVMEEGFTLVISPLLSLIADQLMTLKELDIEAVTINSGNSGDAKEIYAKMLDKNSDLKLVYVTPEWAAKSKRFMGWLQNCHQTGRVNRVVVDEVHCCSHWGHNFRKEYGMLGILRSSLRGVPYLGLTATASTKVLIDVVEMLELKNCVIIKGCFNRPNLFYKVENKPVQKIEVLNYIEHLLKNTFTNQAGIIYTTSVNESMNLAKDLKKRGLKVAPYNAQLTNDERSKIHERWITGVYQAVVATIAFGMGIDKGDVRFVLHHCMPRSIEYLYQESGRAGRDGQKAQCIILFSLNDYFSVLNFCNSVTEKEKVQDVLTYCLDVSNCRRKTIAHYLQEEFEESMCMKMCDVCVTDKSKLKTYDIFETCNDLHSIISRCLSNNENVTLHKLIEMWYRASPKKATSMGVKKPQFSKELAENLISFLVKNGYLNIVTKYNSYKTLHYLDYDMMEVKSIPMQTFKKYKGLPKYKDALDETDEDDAPIAKRPRIDNDRGEDDVIILTDDDENTKKDRDDNVEVDDDDVADENQL